MHRAEWDNQPGSGEMDQVAELLRDLADLKVKGLTAAAVCINFCQWLTQPIKERIHPGFKYRGHSDPSREQNHSVTKEEIIARVSSFLDSEVSNVGAPKLCQLKRPTALVRPPHKHVLRSWRNWSSPTPC